MIEQDVAQPASHRIQQLNSLVQHEVAELLLRHIDWPIDAKLGKPLVTVTRVSVAADAESAKVWLSVLPVTQSDAVLRTVQSNIREIQTLLNKKLVMKFVPKLTFLIDLSESKVESIENVLDKLEFDREDKKKTT